MLRYAGFILLMIGLAALAGMNLMEGSVVYRSWLPQSQNPPVVISTGNKTINMSLPRCRAFYVSSCFEVNRVEGVKFYLDFSTHIPLQTPPSNGVWGYVLDCKLLSSMNVVQNMSQFLNKFHLIKVRLHPTNAGTPVSPFKRWYEARVSLENLTGRKIFAVVYGELKAQQNQSCMISESPTILAVAHPSFDQKIRTLYLIAAGALLLVLHYVRNPDDLRRSVSWFRRLPSRVRRRSSPP